MSATIDLDSDFDAKVEQALRTDFPLDTIDVRKTPRGTIHILIVSGKFNTLTEREKQDWVWDILKAKLAEKSEVVSAILPYSTDELYG